MGDRRTLSSISSVGSEYRDSGAKMGVSLDSRQVLKAFRYIGGFKGVEIEDLRDKVATIRNERVRTALQKDLDAMFARHDADKNGNIDVIEFERMVNSSTLLQTAVYEFLTKCRANDFDTYQQEDTDVRAEHVQLVSVGLVFAHVLIASVALDHSPDWEGWQWIEFVFVGLFSACIVANYQTYMRSSSPWRQWKRTESAGLARSPTMTLPLGEKGETTQGPFKQTEAAEQTGRPTMNKASLRSSEATSLNGTSQKSLQSLETMRIGPFARKLFFFIIRPTNFIDVVVTITGWIEMCIFCFEKTAHKERSTEEFFWSVRRLRIIRFLQLLRVVHVIFFLRDIRTFLDGFMSGMRSALCGFAIITLLVFLWTLFIRQSLVSGWVNDQDGILKEVFPNMHKSMLVVVRCMAIGTDGSCMTSRNESVVVLLSGEFGWLFDTMWILTQAMILCGVSNIVAAIFVLQAHEHAQHIQDGIFCVRSAEDEVRLSSLDKLLRTLIYPTRANFDPKAKHAAEVSRIIQKEHPTAARKIEDLEEQVVEFAKSIQESKNMLQHAMNLYEAQEFDQCQRLQATPSANMYAVDGKEILCVSAEEVMTCNPMGVPSAPDDAVEVQILQESADLSDLLREGQEVQNFVKSLILPESAWAIDQKAGVAESIWKQSKGFCDEAVDPGLKSIERIRQKVSLKYNGNFQRNRDYCRLGLIYESVGHLMQALPKWLEFRLDTDGIEVARLENRFATPHQLGWRDITILLRARVPSTGRKHIMEIQMQLRGLSECRGENHRIYEEIRAVLPDDVVNTILDRLVCDTTLDLGITKEEWRHCTRNADVKNLLDGLGVPATCRQRMFDLVDIDGSGTVTSSELLEILRLFRTPAPSLEIAGCHLRVKDVQRFAQTKLGPQLNKLHKMQKDRKKEYLPKRVVYCARAADESQKWSAHTSQNVATPTRLRFASTPRPHPHTDERLNRIKKHVHERERAVTPLPYSPDDHASPRSVSSYDSDFRLARPITDAIMSCEADIDSGTSVLQRLMQMDTKWTASLRALEETLLSSVDPLESHWFNARFLDHAKRTHQTLQRRRHNLSEDFVNALEEDFNFWVNLYSIPGTSDIAHAKYERDHCVEQTHCSRAPHVSMASHSDLPPPPPPMELLTPKRRRWQHQKVEKRALIG